MSRDMNTVRYRRVLEVLRCLHDNGRASRKRLEEEGGYAVSGAGQQNRTFQRDLQFMREELGAEIEYDPRDNVYVLKHEGSLLVNIKAARTEIEAVCAGLKMASHFLPHLENDAASLWKKLSSYIPHDLAKYGQDLAESAVIAIPVAAVQPEVFKLLVEAKNSLKTVRIRYVSPGKDGRTWTLSPYDFYFRGNAWYMISFNHEHKALSTHKLSRIVRANFAQEKYVLPEEGGFSEEYASSAWYVSPGTERHSITLKLTGNIAEAVSSVKWHSSQRTEKQPDGSVILTAEVPYLEEAARWVLGGAPNVKVIAPQKLKYIVRDMAMSVIDEP
ncbi:MAG: WYL domain-containing protein [Synergistaceae bacterium]|nr:WYL domain-containing protein [Synergistaceae bacterium]